MKTVLFVDDERAVLEALRYALYRDRKRWKLVFASSGAAALEELARQPAHVVVSDLMMPDMDGIALLAEVRARYPRAVRVLLSGNVERAVDGALAHEVLGKPCAPPALRACLERWIEAP
ncbi:MAG TPA: response regulator [Polyangiaceae bacterium]|jgi:CheY-like chemotaxis protein